MKKNKPFPEFEGIKADFITDAQGNKKKVILDIEQFRELLETLEDYYDIAQVAIKKQGEDSGDSLEEVKKRLLK